MLVSGSKVIISGCDVPFINYSLRSFGAEIVIDGNAIPQDIRSILKHEKFPVMIATRKVDADGMDMTYDNMLIIFEGLAVNVDYMRPAYTNLADIRISAVRMTDVVLANIVYQEMAVSQVFGSLDAVQTGSFQMAQNATTGVSTVVSADVPMVNANSSTFLEQLLLTGGQSSYRRVTAPNQVLEFAINNLLQPLNVDAASQEVRFSDLADSFKKFPVYFPMSEYKTNNDYIKENKVQSKYVSFEIDNYCVAQELYKISSQRFTQTVAPTNTNMYLNPWNTEDPSGDSASIIKMARRFIRAETLQKYTDLLNPYEQLGWNNFGVQTTGPGVSTADIYGARDWQRYLMQQIALPVVDVLSESFFQIIATHAISIEQSSMQNLLNFLQLSNVSPIAAAVRNDVAAAYDKLVDYALTLVKLIITDPIELRRISRDGKFEGVDAAIVKAREIMAGTMSKTITERFASSYGETKPDQILYPRLWKTRIDEGVPGLPYALDTFSVVVAEFVNGTPELMYAGYYMRVINQCYGESLVDLAVKALSSAQSAIAAELSANVTDAATGKIILAYHSSAGADALPSSYNALNTYIKDTVKQTTENANLIRPPDKSKYKLFDYLAARNLYNYNIALRIGTFNNLRDSSQSEGEVFPTIILRNYTEVTSMIRNTSTPTGQKFSVLDAIRKIYMSFMQETEGSINKPVFTQEGLYKNIPQSSGDSSGALRTIPSVPEMFTKPQGLTFIAPRCNLLIINDRNKVKNLSPDTNISKLMVGYHLGLEYTTGADPNAPASKYLYDLYNPQDIVTISEPIAAGSNALTAGYGSAVFRNMYLYQMDELRYYDIAADADLLDRMTKLQGTSPVYSDPTTLIDIYAGLEVESAIIPFDVLLDYNTGKTQVTMQDGTTVASTPLKQITVEFSYGNTGEKTYDPEFVGTIATTETLSPYLTPMTTYIPPVELGNGEHGANKNINSAPGKLPSGTAILVYTGGSKFTPYATAGSFNLALYQPKAANSSPYFPDSDQNVIALNVLAKLLNKPASPDNITIPLHVSYAMLMPLTASGNPDLNGIVDMSDIGIGLLNFIKINIFDAFGAALIDGAFQQVFKINTSGTSALGSVKLITTDMKEMMADAIKTKITASGDNLELSFTLDVVTLQKHIKYNSILAQYVPQLTSAIQERKLLLKNYAKLYTRIMNMCYCVNVDLPNPAGTGTTKDIVLSDKVFMSNFVPTFNTAVTSTSTIDVNIARGTRSFALRYPATVNGVPNAYIRIQNKNKAVLAAIADVGVSVVNSGTKSRISNGVTNEFYTPLGFSSILAYRCGIYGNNAKDIAAMPDRILATAPLGIRLQTYNSTSGTHTGRALSYKMSGAAVSSKVANQEWNIAKNVFTLTDKNQAVYDGLKNLLPVMDTGDIQAIDTSASGIDLPSKVRMTTLAADMIEFVYDSAALPLLKDKIVPLIYAACIENIQDGYNLSIKDAQGCSNLRTGIMKSLLMLPAALQRMEAAAAATDIPKNKSTPSATVSAPSDSTDSLFQRRYAALRGLFNSDDFQKMDESPGVGKFLALRTTNGVPYLHEGVDLRIPEPAGAIYQKPLFAPCAGHVIYSLKDDGYGLACVFVPQPEQSVPQVIPAILMGHLNYYKTIAEVLNRNTDGTTIDVTKDIQNLDDEALMKTFNTWTAALAKKDPRFTRATGNGLMVGTAKTVVKGTLIGYMGNSGRGSGPHLHLSCRAVTPATTSGGALKPLDVLMPDIYQQVMSQNKQLSASAKEVSGMMSEQVKKQLEASAFLYLECPAAIPPGIPLAYIYSSSKGIKDGAADRYNRFINLDSADTIGTEVLDAELKKREMEYRITNTMRYKIQQYALQMLKGVPVPPVDLPYHDPYFVDGGFPFCVLYTDDIVFTQLLSNSIQGDTVSTRSNLVFGAGVSLRMMLYYIFKYLKNPSAIATDINNAGRYTFKDFIDEILLYPPCIIPQYNSTLMSKKAMLKEYTTMFGKADFIFNWPDYVRLDINGTGNYAYISEIAANPSLNIQNLDVSWLIDPESKRLLVDLDKLRRENDNMYAGGADDYRIPNAEKEALLKYRSWDAGHHYTMALWKKAYAYKQTTPVSMEEGYLDMFKPKSVLTMEQIDQAFVKQYESQSGYIKETPLTFYPWYDIFARIRKESFK